MVQLVVDTDDLGNLLSYSVPDAIDRFSGMEASIQTLVETGMMLAGATDDVNYASVIENQFSWGKSIPVFYRHPFDDYRVLIATKNILGR